MITIDPEILKKATDAVDAGTPESNRAIVRAIAGNEYIRNILSRGLEKLDEDALASLGTTLQMGLEIGIHYQTILYSDVLEKLESRVNELEAREKAKEAANVG